MRITFEFLIIQFQQYCVYVFILQLKRKSMFKLIYYSFFTFDWWKFSVAAMGHHTRSMHEIRNKLLVRPPKSLLTLTKRFRVNV